MRIGAVYPQIELGGDPEAVRRIGLAVEEMGYDHLLAYDHVVGASHADREPKLTGPYTDNDPFHDPFVMFGYLAALTSRIELVTGVLILPQRQTVIVAKQAADVDLFSGGRLRLGVGVGWNYVEYEALGQDFTTRGARESEQIEFLRRLWAEPLLSFAGTYDRIERANIPLRPKRQIPIWLGGFSEPAFRRGARLGEGFIFGGGTEAALTAWDRVKSLRAEFGLPIENFGADYMATSASDPAVVVAGIEAWRAAGGTHASVNTMRMGLDSIEAHIDYLGQVRSKLDSQRG